MTALKIHRIIANLPVVFLMLIMDGCLLPQGNQPLRVLSSAASSPAQSEKTLLVLLPGRRSAPEAFFEQGFIRDFQQKHPTVDVWAVDAHLGYYVDRNLGRRLFEEIISPARKSGYQRIWLAGISLGGLGSMLYDADYPGTIDGILAISPYLGKNKQVLEELSSFESLADWRPSVEFRDHEGFETKLWPYLQKQLRGDSGVAPLFLACGNQDELVSKRFAILEKEWPPVRLIITNGGHDWPTWRQLWSEWLLRWHSQ